ncbi:MAG TPA: chromate transporter, partial [Pyrinomonadaceae bacterium]
MAQSLPGTGAGNTATYIGLKLRGWRGACVSMAGFILPSMLMMVGLAILYRHLRFLPDTDRLFHGLNAAVVALIFVTAWRIGRNTLNKKWQWVLAVLACLTVAFFGATVIEVVFAAGLVGIFIDSFAEKQLQRWLAARTPTSRRRERIAQRMTASRRKRRASASPSQRQEFYGGYLTRAVAEERVRRAAGTVDELDLDDEEDFDDYGGDGLKPPAKRKLRSVVILGVSMPVFAKLGL